MSLTHLAGSLRGTVNRNAVSGYAPGTLLIARAEVVDDASHVVVLHAVERRLPARSDRAGPGRAKGGDRSGNEMKVEWVNT